MGKRPARDELVRQWRREIEAVLLAAGEEHPSDAVLGYLAQMCAEDGRPPSRTTSAAARRLLEARASTATQQSQLKSADPKESHDPNGSADP